MCKAKRCAWWHKLRYAALLLLLCGAGSVGAPLWGQSLWYTRPAAFFEEALPIGNGRIGAMVYGGVDTLRLSLNDITLWTGEPDTAAVNPSAHSALPAVRAALGREDYAAADSLVRRVQGKETEKYQPLGTLFIDFLDSIGVVDGYRRELDLSTATATSRYTTAAGEVTTACFASAPDSCLVVRLTTTAPQGLALRVRLSSLLPHSTAVEQHTLVSTGYAAYAANAYYLTGVHGEELFYDPCRGIHFCTRVAVSSDGALSDEAAALVVRGAKEVTLFIVNETSFNGAACDPASAGRDYMSLSLAALRRAEKKGYAAVRAAQQEDYKALYDRVELSLGATADSIRCLSTDEQLRRYTAYNEANPELEALYFQYGRYLLIATSRTEGVPATLQGLWNEALSPPWRSNYTVNINIEEIYWPVEVVNLTELHRPLLTFLRQLARTGRQSAQAYYGIAAGWCCGHNSDIWGTTNPIGEGIANPQWANWAMGGAWLATHIWEHYLFTGDRAFLSEYYPILRGAAEFCMAWLVEKDGELIAPVSTSPENMYLTDEGYAGNTFYGGTADMALTRECLTAAAAAADALAVDSAWCDSVAATLCQLRPYHIGSRGQLLEWYHDWADADWTHRHQSHLVGLYPGHQLTTTATEALCAAAARSLALKGTETTGWSTGWRMCLYARLGDSDGAYGMLRRLLRYVSPEGYTAADRVVGGGTYPNLLDAHPPFQLDGNCGGTAGIAEMLVQSAADGTVRLLPACPAAWSEGYVRGLCVRGGGVLTMRWRDGEVIESTIEPRQ